MFRDDKAFVVFSYSMHLFKTMKYSRLLQQSRNRCRMRDSEIVFAMC